MDNVLTVTSPAASYDLVELDVVNYELGFADVNTARDAQISRWITAYSKRLAKLCGCIFPAEGISETFRLRWMAHPEGLYLTRQPVISVTTVSVAGSALDASGYEVSGAGVLYRLSGDCRICWPPGKTVASYRAGYDPIPDELADAVVTLIRHRWSAKDRDPLLRSQTDEGVGREDYWVPLQNDSIDAVPPELQPIADVISSYRVLALA